jgi:hypothetical protein
LSWTIGREERPLPAPTRRKKSVRETLHVNTGPRLLTMVIVVVIAAFLIGTVALAQVLLKNVLQNPGGPGPSSIRSAFFPGTPALHQCPQAMVFVASGCKGGDFYFLVPISASTVVFEDVLFKVVAGGDSNWGSPGSQGFAIINGTGAAVADYQTGGGVLLMTSGWNYSGGVSPGTPLTHSYQVTIDVGVTDPSSAGVSLVTIGAVFYTGETVPLNLP